MSAENYSRLAGLIFAIVAALQLTRALSGWPVTVGTISIPFYPALGKLDRLRRCRCSCVARLRRISSRLKGAGRIWNICDITGFRLFLASKVLNCPEEAHIENMRTFEADEHLRHG